MEYDENLKEILHEVLLDKGLIEEHIKFLLRNHDTTEYEFIQFFKDHINCLNIAENVSEFLHSIFNNLSTNHSLMDVNSHLEYDHDMIYDNDGDLYVDYLIDDLNIAENDNDVDDDYEE